MNCACGVVKIWLLPADSKLFYSLETVIFTMQEACGRPQFKYKKSIEVTQLPSQAMTESVTSND